MERCLKDSGDSANPRRTAQKKTPQDSAQGAPASRIDASPLMVAQRKKLQSLFGGAAQLREEPAPKPNNTGLPDNLKSGIESLSGMSMDHVKVHYNSSMPAQLNALAYAQGSDIHVAPGQEKHLPHEAWHVVQQAQGRVKPTMQMKGGVAVNDDQGLEREADAMGARVLEAKPGEHAETSPPLQSMDFPSVSPVQGRWRMFQEENETTRQLEARIRQMANVGSYAIAFDSLLRTSSIETSAGLLRFNALRTAYRAAGRLGIVTDVLRDTYLDTGHDYEPLMVLDMAEGNLSQRLQQMFAARRVVMAGETHGDPESAAMETLLLPHHGVSVKYEGDIINTIGGDVEPDPPAYRLLYYIEDFYDTLWRRKNSHHLGDKTLYEQLDLMTAIYNRYIVEFDKYSMGDAITNSLPRDSDNEPMISLERLNELKNILYATVELIEEFPLDPNIYKESLIRENAIGLFDLFDSLKTLNGLPPRNEPVMRELRSIRMFEVLNSNAVCDSNTVYKVGNRHVTDIIGREGTRSWLFTEAAYKNIFRL